MKYEEQSTFNMALAYLERINKLLYLCQKAAMEQNVDNWAAHLRGVYREASVRLTDEEEKEIIGDPDHKIDVEALTDKYIKPEECNFKNIYFLMNDVVHKRKHKKIIMFLLDGLEVKIRKLLQKKGMLLPSKDDPRRAITQR